MNEENILVKVILLSSLGTGLGVEFTRITSLSLLNFNIIVGTVFIILFQFTFWFSFLSLIKMSVIKKREVGGVL